MKTRFTALLVLTTLALTAPVALQAQVISTLTGGSYIGSGSIGSANGWGQTFQTPDAVAAALDQFTVRVSDSNGMSFEAFIYEWTESLNSSGSGFAAPAPEALKWSATVTGGPDNLVNFDTGHLALDAATSYAFYIASNSNNYNGIPVLGSAAYSFGGAFVWHRSGLLSAPLSGTNYTGAYDLQFEATFSALSISPVPEPATYATIGLAVCGVLALVHRRRRLKPAVPAVAA